MATNKSKRQQISAVVSYRCIASVRLGVASNPKSVFPRLIKVKSCARDGRVGAFRSYIMRTLIGASLATALIISTAVFAQEPSATPTATPPVAGAPGGSTDPVPTPKPSTSDSNGPTSNKTDPTKDKGTKITSSQKADSMPSPGEALDPHIKKGSEDDVDAVGTRNIGGRGIGNWYSTDWEIRNGKQYSMEIEKSGHMVTDPVFVDYVNRVGQNIVKNSDCKVPFTIKVIDADEINAMALPGGFFYVNSGMIMAADEEAELAGVMAHEAG